MGGYYKECVIMNNNELNLEIIVSFIIPMYNAEKTIEKLLYSIEVSQVSYEIICIDDGSLDNTAQVVLRNSLRNNRIKYFYQSNSGPSVARNYGLSLASGKYIMFADSDDVYTAELKYLTEILISNKYNVIVFPYVTKHSEIGIMESKVLDIRNFLIDGYDKSDLYVHALWNKVYSRELLLSLPRFPVDCSLGEDAIYNLRIFSNIKEISVVNLKAYNYIINEDSLSHSSKNLKILGESYKRIYEELETLSYQYNVPYAYAYAYVSAVINEFIRKRKLSQDEYRYFKCWLKENREAIAKGQDCSKLGSCLTYLAKKRLTRLMWIIIFCFRRLRNLK